MHIGLVTITYPPDNGWGGIGSYVFHLSHGLIALGHQVTVICGMGKEIQEYHNNGLHIIRCLRTEGVNNYQIQHQVADVLSQIIYKHKVDIIEFAEFGAMGLEFQKRYPNFPNVVKLHGDSQLCRLGNYPLIERNLRKVYYQIRPIMSDNMERDTVARANAVISPSNWLIQQCLKRGWVLPNYRHIIASPFGGWTQDIEFFNKDYTIPKIVSLGRLDFLKGVSLMPGIFRTVWQEVPETQFELLGQTMYRKNGDTWSDWLLKKIPKKYHNQVLITGGIPYLELPKYLAPHSIAFFASTWESFGYSHIECMYTGIACVIGSNGGAKEVGVNNVSCLNTARNVNSISKALLQLIKNPELRKNIGQSARQHVLEQYSPTHIATQMLEVYQYAMQEK